MTFEIFCEKAAQAMREYMGEGCEVFLQEIKKNNGLVLTGLLAHTEDDVAIPTIYLNDYYRILCSGEDFSVIMQHIFQFYERYSGVKMDMEFFNNFSTVKSKIVCKLIHRDRNEALLEDVPFIPWEDLAIVFCYIHIGDDLGSATIMIRNEHCKMWGIETEELYQCAMQNTPKLMGEEIFSIKDMLMSLAEEDLRSEVEDLEDLPMFILTNKWKQFGAMGMLYSEKMKELSDAVAHNLFIMPSSIHEGATRFAV